VSFQGILNKAIPAPLAGRVVFDRLEEGKTVTGHYELNTLDQSRGFKGYFRLRCGSGAVVGSAPSSLEFRRSIGVVEKLPCDVLLSPHPELFDMEEKLQRGRTTAGVNSFINAGACKAYAAEARRGLERRVAEEMGGPGLRKAL
jgi:hypothetical protein